MNAAAHADVSAEMYVLGAVLVSGGRVLDSLASQLRPGDFYRPVHEAMWQRMLVMHAKGEPLEATAFLSSLQDEPIRGCDGAYLFACVTECTSPANADWYAETRIRPLARLRRLSQAAAKVTQLVGEATPETVEETFAASLGALEVAGADVGQGELATLNELMLLSMDRWERPEEGIVPIGLVDVDRASNGGLRPGHLMVIAARPAMGKSLVATVIANQVARRGVGTYMASLEMDAAEVVDRVVADVAGVELSRLTERRLDERDWDRVAAAQGRTAEWPFVIDDRPDLTVAAIRGRARDVSRRMNGGLRIVIVDYLQLVNPADTRVARHEQVGAISRGLKLMARELGVTVIALAQLNRGPVTRADKRPVMSDLRESGAIEADADEVVLLHRDDDKSPGVLEWIIEKNRTGKTGTVKLSWLPQYARVASLMP